MACTTETDFMAASRAFGTGFRFCACNLSRSLTQTNCTRNLFCDRKKRNRLRGRYLGFERMRPKEPEMYDKVVDKLTWHNSDHDKYIGKIYRK